MSNIIKAPHHLLQSPFHLRSLQLDGFSVIESCMHEAYSTGSMFLDEHVVVFVLEGRYVVRAGKSEARVSRNEAVLIKKAHSVDYQKIGFDKSYEGLMFFIKDDFLKAFIKTARIAATRPATETHPVFKLGVDEKLLGFVESVKPYFNEPDKAVSGLLNIKLMELLYNLSFSNPLLFAHLLEFSNPVPKDLVKIMAENFTKPMQLDDFAYLAGRSLASFKRDFAKVFQTSPAKWLMEKRLDYARRLLASTDMKIIDVSDEAGFESVAHFSRLFKRRFGASPSHFKIEPHSQEH
jgi:AraC family transcriptional regulator, exoenzyme S synthesis regulatory protein ExsA